MAGRLDSGLWAGGFGPCGWVCMTRHCALLCLLDARVSLLVCCFGLDLSQRGGLCPPGQWFSAPPFPFCLPFHSCLPAFCCGLVWLLCNVPFSAFVAPPAAASPGPALRRPAFWPVLLGCFAFLAVYSTLDPPFQLVFLTQEGRWAVASPALSGCLTPLVVISLSVCFLVLTEAW